VILVKAGELSLQFLINKQKRPL
jgi:hypothetical protein